MISTSNEAKKELIRAEESVMKETVYLVTGATGFIGSNVCSQLLERGARVKAFVMPNNTAIKYVPG